MLPTTLQGLVLSFLEAPEVAALAADSRLAGLRYWSETSVSPRSNQVARAYFADLYRTLTGDEPQAATLSDLKRGCREECQCGLVLELSASSRFWYARVCRSITEVKQCLQRVLRRKHVAASLIHPGCDIVLSEYLGRRLISQHILSNRLTLRFDDKTLTTDCLSGLHVAGPVDSPYCIAGDTLQTLQHTALRLALADGEIEAEVSDVALTVGGLPLVSPCLAVTLPRRQGVSPGPLQLTDTWTTLFQGPQPDSLPQDL
ncbi:MAG: hypothetical protein KVP17_000073 [Porospora cf. gigantea B]|uniref:uncharacterized protein n=1 Tax=Porospora cf. gigantea B TaxID=2853592 RepID=UPI003571A344|nr:MAG: hypothetical protein KVP17_000073 [Porospora cf. gigantea B]